MKIAVIGTGYVGLTTGTCLAELGNDVICVDVIQEKIDMLNKGKIPIYEPGIEELVLRNKKEGRLEFTTNIKKAIKFAEIIFICVGTPPRPNGEADLIYVENVARTISENIDSYKVIVEKSTVPVETGLKVAETIKQNVKGNVEFDVVSNPEFLREGSAVHDTFNPDRVVIGTDSKKAQDIMKKLYKPLKAPIIVTDIKSAEIIKHASNSFLAMKISFINAVANICEAAGADIEKVAEGMGYDKRIGRAFLNAGIGYGGFCFPKDTDAFIRISEKLGYDFRLLKEVQEINKDRIRVFLDKIEKAVWNLKDKTIGVWGLSFKADTDDMRFAPSVEIIRYLQKEGARIKAYDPEAIENARKILKDIEYCEDPYETCKDSDCLLLLTEWKEFKEIDIEKVKNLMKIPLLIDGRNIYDPEEMNKSGFRYVSIGRR